MYLVHSMTNKCQCMVVDDKRTKWRPRIIEDQFTLCSTDGLIKDYWAT